MNRTISSDDIRQQWDSIIEITKGGDDVIVEARGEPQAVVVSPETYQKLQSAQENQRRAEAVARLEALRRRQAERNKDLTDDEIEELANRASREAVDDLAAEGKLRFERDRR